METIIESAREWLVETYGRLPTDAEIEATFMEMYMEQFSYWQGERATVRVTGRTSGAGSEAPNLRPQEGGVGRAAVGETTAAGTLTIAGPGRAPPAARAGVSRPLRSRRPRRGPYRECVRDGSGSAGKRDQRLLKSQTTSAKSIRPLPL